MRSLVVIAAVLTALAVVESAGAVSRGVVESAYDGDTVRLDSGQRVRLLQIDTPEIGSGECYSRAARRALLGLAPLASRVTLEADPALDQVDRYGRLLRYVWRNGTNVNLALVRQGAAAPYFYGGDRGRYAGPLLAAARAAKAARRGLWQACPHTQLDPDGPVQTSAAGPSGTPGHGFAPGKGCDPSYPTVCIPPPPPDLDCRDVPYRRFKVLPPDPHGFDGNRDGVGCET